jgi:O-antigen/teichoic acid export membrane protein
MKAVKKLAGETLIYGMSTIVPRLLNYLLLTPFYTRLFEKSEYGIVTELFAYIAFLLVILTYGMETACFRFAESENDKKRVFSTAMLSVLFTSVLFTGIILFFHESIASLIRYESNSEYIIWLGLIVATDAFMAIPFARLRQQNRAFRFAMIKIASVIINIGFNLLFLVWMPDMQDKGSDSFLLAFYDPEMGVGYAFIANLIAVFATLLLLSRDILAISLTFDKDLLKRMLFYAWPLLIIGIAGMINEVSDKIVFKFLVEVPENVADSNKYILDQIGIYGANTKIAVLMTLFIQMFRFAAEPFFFAQSKEKDSLQMYAVVMKYFILFCLLIFLGVMLFLDLVKYFIDAKFHEGLIVVPIILTANMFLGIFYNLSIWYKLKNLTLYGAGIAVIGSLVTLVINILLVPDYGYIGAAWAHLLCYTVMMIIAWWWGNKYLPVKYDIRATGFYFILAYGIAFLGMYLRHLNDSLSLPLSAGLFFAFILVIVYKEKQHLQNILHR